MASNRFLYQIIRFIPDLARMEAKNIGVIVQGGGEVAVKPNRQVTKWGKAKEHTESIKKWFQYFEEEISAPTSKPDDIIVPISTLIPDRRSERFLEYLMKQATGQIKVSRPFALEYRTEKTINTVIDELYRKLVATDTELEETTEEKPSISKSITNKFKECSRSKQFYNRGLHQDRHVTLPDGVKWFSYRNFHNGALNLIEKVEFSSDISRTGLEANKLLFLLREERPKTFGTDYKLTILLDPFRRFSKLPDDENEAFRKDREEIGNLALAQNVELIENESGVEKLVNFIDEHLPKL